MKRFVTPSVLLSLLLSPFCLYAGEKATQPNILFIFCDDLGYGDVGVFYQNSRRDLHDSTVPHFGTPAIDTLARDGVMLTRHYCAAPVCAPSRSSLLTGLTQGHATVRDNQFDKALDDTYTLGSVLQKAGYATAAFGKWGLQGGDPKADKNPAADRPMAERLAERATWDGFPTNRGFDYFYGYIRHRDGHFHYPKEDGREVWENDREVSAGLDLAYTTDLFAARAKQWIIDHQKNNPDQPFMAYLAHDTPHAILHNPSTAYPDGRGVSGGLQWLGKPGRMINTAEGAYDAWMHPEFAHRTYDHDGDPATAEKPWPDVQKRYANLVRRIDDTVGDLLQTLKDLGIADNTLVVFTSDNGPSKESYLNEEYAPTFFEGFGPFAGIKRDTLEGGIREPTLARWPARFPAGSEDNTPSGHWDWLATFADAAGQPTPAASDGVSLLGSLSGRGERAPSTVYMEYFNPGRSPNYQAFLPQHRNRKRGQMQAVFHGGYKGLRYNIQSADDDFEIYDIVNDPRESENLAKLASFAGVQAQMKARVLQVRRPNASAPRPYDDALIPSVAKISAKEEGWKHSTFRGSWSWLPDFSVLHADSVSSANALQAPKSRNAGVAFEAWVNVPVDGTYTAKLRGEGAKMLFVHESRVISAEDTEYAEASVHLASGWHPVKVYAAGGSTSSELELNLLDATGQDVLATAGAVRH
ncbi:MAG: arylsulfatase [Synoicihabitans sp.]